MWTHKLSVKQQCDLNHIFESGLEVGAQETEVVKDWNIPLGGRAHGAADTGSPESTIAARILGQVLLVVILGIVEIRSGQDFRRYRTVA